MFLKKFIFPFCEFMGRLYEENCLGMKNIKHITVFDLPLGWDVKI